jgi:SAM-dependent methyltransferase
MPEAATPGNVERTLARCAAGETSPNVALAQIFMAVTDEAAARRALADAIAVAARNGDPGPAQRLRAARDLWARHPDAFDDVLAVLAVERRQAADAIDVAHWAAVFDRALAVSPAASVALYSLGDPELLDAATGEITDWMRSRNLLGRERTAIEIGCGTGRCLHALARDLGFVVGLDVSRAMIGAARERCAGDRNVATVQTSGHDLAAFAHASADLVFSVDVFPYLVSVDADLAACHVSESARVLRRGGSLLILNYSYRGDPAMDRRDMRELASRFGLKLLRNGTREFGLWDGLAFHLERVA